MATTVKITETYDLKTTVGKVGLVGVHTPTLSLLRKLYPGLMKNHRFVRFLKCNVVGACASVLPADPLQVGVSEGDVAPEDMFNPILYTAVTNESFDTLIGRINALSGIGSLASVDAGNMLADAQSSGNNFKVYYALLADDKKFRKSMPQNGFNIRNLVPLAHTLISPFGNVGGQGNVSALADDGETPIPVPDMTVPTVTGNMNESSTPAIYYRGKSVRMPKFPLHFGLEAAGDTALPNIPKTNVLALVLPPARLHEFYYRMRVSWTVRFENVISNIEAGDYSALTDIGTASHYTNYSFTSSKEVLDNVTDSVDVSNVDINKIMES